MSDMLRKLNSMAKKANARNRELVLELDLILDESNPKFHWNEDTWKEYIQYEKQKGNKVIYLSQRLFQQQKEHIEQYEQLEMEFEELESMQQSMEHEE